MDGTFKRIVRRLNCQSQLWMQLRNLGEYCYFAYIGRSLGRAYSFFMLKNIIFFHFVVLETRTLQIPSELQKFFPSKNSTIFMSWEAIDWKTYKSFPSTVYPITVELVQSSAMFFKAILERGRGELDLFLMINLQTKLRDVHVTFNPNFSIILARIIAAIALTLNYPDDPPIFSVHLDDSGIGKNRVSSSVFRVCVHIHTFAGFYIYKWSWPTSFAIGSGAWTKRLLCQGVCDLFRQHFKPPVAASFVLCWYFTGNNGWWRLCWTVWICPREIVWVSCQRKGISKTVQVRSKIWWSLYPEILTRLYFILDN